MEETFYADTIQKQIKKSIEALLKKYKRIERTEISVAQGKSLNKQQKALLRSKPCVSMMLARWKKLLDQTKQGKLCSSPHSVSSSTETNTADLVIENTVEAASESDDGVVVRVDEREAIPHVCSIQRKSRLNEFEDHIINLDVPMDKERFLCISDGFMIYCLDLKLCKDESNDPNSLPIISSLNLLEKGHPATVGFFKYGTDTYMVSGQNFPSFKKKASMELLDQLYDKYSYKGSSRKTSHLTLKNSELTLDECHELPLLNKPKFWPIVEIIDDKIHVIESLPKWGCNHICPPLTLPSHEFLDLKNIGHGWTKVLPMCHRENVEEGGMFIRQHLVVGHRIFAYANRYEFLEFESETNSWKCDVEPEQPRDQVGYDLDIRHQICVGRFLPESKSREEPLYLVIGVGMDRTEPWKDWEMMARAYLVSPMGRVRCSQNLPRVFEGKMISMLLGACLFKADDEKTVCIVALLYTTEILLYISTLTVEEIEIQTEVGAQMHDDDEEDFVKVDIKDFHVYRVGSDQLLAGLDAHVPTPRFSAFFL